MLAFTIQFPNNNPAPPQTHPRGNNPQPPPQRMKTTNHHHARHAHGKHRTNTETPRTPCKPQPATTTNPQHAQQRIKGQQPITSQARRLVASKPNSMPNHTSHTTPPPSFQHPKGCVLDSNSAAQPQPVPRPHHTTPQGADQAHALSSTEFIDIPPMSNPPGQHSCPAWATKKWLAP